MEESEQSHQSVMATLADINPTPEDALITAQKLSELRDNIKKLKPHYQEVIQLFYFQELSYAEMAEKLQEPLSRIKVKLLRARQLLASIISASGQ
jgi:RNA polymerase sigma-70 factor (ECF subfamily)